MEVVAESHQHFLTSLALHVSTGDLYALCAASGEILRCDVAKKEFIEIVKTTPSPAAFTFLDDTDEPQWVMASPGYKTLFVSSAVPADSALEGDSGDAAEVPTVPLQAWSTSAHAAVPLHAPTAVTVSPADGEIFFTDAGWEGESSLLNPIGAVYRTVHQRTAVVALQPTGVAQPSGVAVGRDGCVFVCEMCQNRLLRYVPRGSGLQYFGGVFASFRGSMGPSAVAVHPHTGHIFVALYEAADVGRPYGMENDETSSAAPPLRGRVVELDLGGAEVCVYHLPDTQLRALAFDQQGGALYVVCSDSLTCWSTLYRFPLNDSDS